VSSTSIELAKHVLMVFGVILALGTASAVLAQKLRMPDVVIFLVIGAPLGADVTGAIDIRADSALN
jgi:cell volume regulation protein A